MSSPTNLRIMVSCVTFETVKILDPIKHYRIDRAYLLYYGRKPVYEAFLEQVQKELKKNNIQEERVEVEVYLFRPVLKEMLAILKMEREAGNHVYVNIAAGPAAFSSAAMVACMMERAIPVFVGTREYTVDAKHYFIDGKAVGMTKATYPPSELPLFHLEPPPEKEVKALRAWKSVKDAGGITSDTRIIKKLEQEGLMKDIHDELGKVSQKAKMMYRRRYLDKWKERGWIEPIGRGRYQLTEDGKVAVEVFYN